MRDRCDDMAQIITDFVPLKWHDLARCIAGHCGNKIALYAVADTDGHHSCTTLPVSL